MTLRQRLEAFLFSRRNLVASALGLVGLALYLLGITGGILWLPIVAGLYLIGVLLTPSEKGLDLRLGGAQDQTAVREGLDRLVRQVHGRIADDLNAKVLGIRDSILATLPSDSDLEGVSERDVYLIRQTALDYLPAALDAYLALPRAYAERRHVSGGQTPHDVLLEQLELMDGKMAEVADDIARQDSDRLLAHGRFLAEKFSTSSLSLDQGAAAATSAQEAAAGADGGARVAAEAGEGTRSAVETPAPERERAH